MPILIGPNRSKESVQFMLAGGISSDGRATLLLIPVQMGCENISVDLFLLRRGACIRVCVCVCVCVCVQLIPLRRKYLCFQMQNLRTHLIEVHGEVHTEVYNDL